MDQPAPFPPSSVSPCDRTACDQHGDIMRKNPAETAADNASASRRWFAAMLWAAFPSPSENDLATKAARVLSVSPRQVKNWLRCEHDASLRYVTAVMAIAGAEVVFRRMEPRA